MIKKSYRRVSFQVSVLILFVSCAAVYSQERDDVARARAFVEANEARVQDARLLEKVSLLTKLAPAAYFAGDSEKAQKFAHELQIQGGEVKKSNRGLASVHDQATHVSNTVLGLLAVERGDLTGAKKQMLAAGDLTTGSPALRSFGPNMMLAKKMIENGERDAVIQYLDLCSNFWVRKKDVLEEWKNTVKRGEMPDFGGNIVVLIALWKDS